MKSTTAIQCQILHDRTLGLLREFFNASALVSRQGELLVLQYQSLADIGTLPAAARTCQQFFGLKEGDLVLMNDPYSGGSVLSSLNLVFGLREALLVVRVPFRPRVLNGASVDGEGVRVPPSPLGSIDNPNWDLLKAIASHPLAPHALMEVVGATLTRLKEFRGRWQRALLALQVEWSTSLEQAYLKFAEEAADQALQDLSEGSVRLDFPFGQKCKATMRIEVRQHRVAFDFTGTSAPDTLALSDAATHGACLGALVASLAKDIPITGGLLRRVDIVAPLGSAVHARYPAPVFLGFTEGAPIIAHAVLKALGQIDPRRASALSSISRLSTELDFDSGASYFEDVEPGAPAFDGAAGADAFDPFLRTHLHRSVEASERLFPLRFQSIAVRSDSGGSGRHLGGNGMTKVIELLAPARLRWNMAPRAFKPEGLSGGKSGLLPELQVLKAGQLEELEACGEMSIAPGDQVILKSGGAGGFGPLE